MNQKAPGAEPVRAVGDELHGAGAGVADRECRLHRGLAHRRAKLRTHAGRQRLLDHLLMAALQRAVALVEMDRVAVRVGEHLHLDMARRRDIFLDQHAVVAERILGLALGCFQHGFEIGMLVDAPHPLAAAAGDGLDQHRIADLISLLLEEGRLLAIAVIARHHRHPGLLHQRLGAAFQSHGADRLRRRADEDEAGLCARLGELGILRKKSVARMHTLRAGLPRHLDQLVDAQIAFGRRRRPDRISLVALPNVKRACVSVRIDRDGAKPKPRGGARDPAGDLAAVGNQDRREHEPRN